jgi:hypothetical protein
MPITSNFYSVLYYNSEIGTYLNFKWNIITVSANALKPCTPNYHYLMSYDHTHSVNNHVQPHQI